jgi:formylglycine-generating enzyme required for sulfatase activity
MGNDILQDGRTGLHWTRVDNGVDIDWNDAGSYCTGKGKGWRLPSIEELWAIYDEAGAGARCAQAVCKVSPQFNLTGNWFWSATQVGKDSTDGIELAWGLLMVNGARTQSVRDASYGSRALCVR